MDPRVCETIINSYLYSYQLIPQLYFCDDYTSVNTSEIKGLQLYYNMGTGKTYTAIVSACEYCKKYV